MPYNAPKKKNIFWTILDHFGLKEKGLWVKMQPAK